MIQCLIAAGEPFATLVSYTTIIPCLSSLSSGNFNHFRIFAGPRWLAVHKNAYPEGLEKTTGREAIPFFAGPRWLAVHKNTYPEGLEKTTECNPRSVS